MLISSIRASESSCRRVRSIVSLSVCAEVAARPRVEGELDQPYELIHSLSRVRDVDSADQIGDALDLVRPI